MVSITKQALYQFPINAHAHFTIYNNTTSSRVYNVDVDFTAANKDKMFTYTADYQDVADNVPELLVMLIQHTYHLLRSVEEIYKKKKVLHLILHIKPSGDVHVNMDMLVYEEHLKIKLSTRLSKKQVFKKKCNRLYRLKCHKYLKRDCHRFADKVRFMANIIQSSM